jgi:uncharacterized Ntn-hydrolase superfamily protein
VATQNITNPALGPVVLSLLQRALPVHDAVHAAIAADPHGDYRQLVGIGRTGPPAVWSGSRILGIHGEALGDHAAAAGNLLAERSVPSEMLNAFERAGGHFGARLLQALHAGLRAGGEAGPMHSAGLLIARDVAWPIVDLRVDWTQSDPIADLSSIWDVYAPQIEDYVRRAQDPAGAPSFRVPGDPGSLR